MGVCMCLGVCLCACVCLVNVCVLVCRTLCRLCDCENRGVLFSRISYTKPLRFVSMYLAISFLIVFGSDRAINFDDKHIRTMDICRLYIVYMQGW